MNFPSRKKQYRAFVTVFLVLAATPTLIVYFPSNLGAEGKRIHTLKEALERKSSADTQLRGRSDAGAEESFQDKKKPYEEDGKSSDTEATAAGKVYDVVSTGTFFSREQQPYIIGRDDILEISVWRSPELTQEVTVGLDGMIDYAFFGKIDAAGLTLKDLAERIREKLLQGYLKDPQVSVKVKEYNSKKILVFGEVLRPGLYKLRNGIPLLELLFLVGGVKQDAKRMTVMRLRDDSLERIPAGLRPEMTRSERNEETSVHEVNLIALLSKGDLSQNIMIQPGDTLYVSSGTGEKFYVLGQVLKPGPYEWVQPITVLEALKIAGGPTEQAALNRIKVRKRGQGGEVELRVNTVHIMQGKDEDDVTIEAGSIVVVPRSWI